MEHTWLDSWYEICYRSNKSQDCDIYILLTYHSTMPRSTQMIFCMTVEWSSLLRGCLATRTIWSMPHEGRTPSTPFTSCSGPTLGPSAWHSWPSQRLRQPFMVPSYLRISLFGATVSPSFALCGSICGTTSVCWMRSDLSWSCNAPRECTRYNILCV